MQPYIQEFILICLTVIYSVASHLRCVVSFFLVNLRSCVQNLKRTRIQQVQWNFSGNTMKIQEEYFMCKNA